MDPSPNRTPLQARARHFFKKFALRTRGSGKGSKNAVSPVAIPTHNFQRAHASVDLLRKPDISPFVGFRVEDGVNPMDTDDSSQDASASGNSPRIRSRCHSTWDCMHSASIHPTFAGRGAAPLFFRDQTGPGNEFDAGNVLAPAPLFLRSTLSLDAAAQPCPRSPVLHPDIAPQFDATSGHKPFEDAVHDTLDDDKSQPLGSHDASLMAPSAEAVPSTSSHPSDLSRSQSVPAPASETLPEQPTSISRHSASLPPPFRLVTERGLRLSPSIIARQPMPILNLPTLLPPPPPPLAEGSPPRQNTRLRSMPSLSRHGRSSSECQVDHESALDDSDEDEGEEEEEPTDVLSVHQSDEDDEEPPNTDIPGVDKNLEKQHTGDGECPADDPVSPSSNLANLFCSKTYVSPMQIVASPTSLAMHPFSADRSDAEEMNQRHTLDLDTPLSGARLDRKPSLYRVASRSMINLCSTRRAERGLCHLRSKETAGLHLASASGRTTETRAESEESDTEAVIGRLRRRTSMPNFHPTSDPPPYPTFNPRPRESRDVPPEDEGRERLPPYSNSLYLIAIMPRKMEFSSPGVQAKDRKWRRVVCELEGTTFRVYKCPPGASGAGVLGDWWEKRVGVGDVASPNPPRARKKEEPFERPAKLGIDEAPTAQPVSPGRSTPRGETRPRTESQSSVGTHSTRTSTPRPAKRISGASFLSPFRSSSSTQPETNAGETSHRTEESIPVGAHESHSVVSHESTGRTTPARQRLSQPSLPRSAARLNFLPGGTEQAPWRKGEMGKPPLSSLIRAYTLQHAESGLGNDYLKRKNVIRARLEGEQFLLQAPDVPAVVEWIEGLHAGTNIALDIDQRPMPRGPLFPRRRRRRARRVQGDEPPAQTATN